MANRAEKYIEIVPRGKSPTGKTGRWVVKRKGEAQPFGWIDWYGGWRKYVFHVAEGSYFDHDCLRMIADFIDMQTRKQMGLPKKDQ